ncbi:MAG: hypothetical protein MjAS7_0927 [Metallosphaera javensis (ex Sakai et al. 2022)]|nr:MAG: hypothetical protein MjAS7_0927 [Metallosphaera javensis (ex Sakai et al. 2022)]
MEKVVIVEKVESIKVKETTKQELIRIRGELESRYGRKFSLDDTINYLIASRGREHRDPVLLERIFGVLKGEDLYRELQGERKADKERIERKFGL